MQYMTHALLPMFVVACMSATGLNAIGQVIHTRDMIFANVEGEWALRVTVNFGDGDAELVYLVKGNPSSLDEAQDIMNKNISMYDVREMANFDRATFGGLTLTRDETNPAKFNVQGIDNDQTFSEIPRHVLQPRFVGNGFEGRAGEKLDPLVLMASDRFRWRHKLYELPTSPILIIVLVLSILALAVFTTWLIVRAMRHVPPSLPTNSEPPQCQEQ